MHSTKICLRAAIGLLLLAVSWQSAQADDLEGTQFKRIPTQYLAVLGDPDASAGDGAEKWGIWREDPGPRGVFVRNFEEIQSADGVAPAGWEFDPSGWWLEENGQIMESPEFPVPPGRYVVTGNRETTAVLTIHPADDSGNRRWELSNGATIYDVTHLRCRSARYTPAEEGKACSPDKVQSTWFPVTPGAAMPPVRGCNKKDYSVLFVVGMVVDD